MKTLIKKLFLIRWEWYRDFFQITILRYLVMWFSIVPLIYMALKNIPEEINFEIGTKTVQLTFQLPFSWELLWMSSFCFVLASLVYMFRAPQFIKKYPSYSEYKTHLHSPRWIIWESRDLINAQHDIDMFVSRLLTKGYMTEIQTKDNSCEPTVEVTKESTILQFNHKKKTYELSLPPKSAELNNNEKATEKDEQEVFWEVFGRFSAANPISRITTVCLLYLSLGFFSVVLVQHIWVMLNILVDKYL